MTLLRMGCPLCALSLLLPGVGSTPSVSHVALAGAKKPAHVQAKPLVKIDGAMVQERITLPNGAVQVKTYLNGRLVPSDKKKSPPTRSSTPKTKKI